MNPKRYVLGDGNIIRYAGRRFFEMEDSVIFIWARNIPLGKYRLELVEVKEKKK